MRGRVVCLFTDGLDDAQVGDARVGRDEVLADRMSDDTAAVVLSRR